jgi:hypothetical protein
VHRVLRGGDSEVRERQGGNVSNVAVLKLYYLGIAVLYLAVLFGFAFLHMLGWW